MATAKKLPSGKWRVQLYCGKDENGKRIYESFTAPTKKEAERMAATFDGNRKQRAADRAAGRITLAQAMDEFIETCRATGKSPATINAYCSMRRTYGELLSMTLNTIRVQDVQQAINEWAKTQSPKTIRNRLSLLTPTLKANGIKIDMDAIQVPKSRNTEMIIPQDEDVQRMIQHLRHTDKDLYLAVLIASTLGMRRSEICALEWADINFKEGKINVSKAVVLGDDGLWHTKETKTRAGTRSLFVAPDVLAELAKHRQFSGKIINVTPNTISDHYRALTRKMNIPGRFHDLRHYMASVMAALNIPERYAVEIMGHATNNMLHRVYQHTMERKRDAVYELIDSHSKKIVSGDDVAY